MRMRIVPRQQGIRSHFPIDVDFRGTYHISMNMDPYIPFVVEWVNDTTVTYDTEIVDSIVGKGSDLIVYDEVGEVSNTSVTETLNYIKVT